MKKIFVVNLLAIIIFSAQAFAGNVRDELKNYFNDIAIKVRNTENVHQKREILNNSFKKILTALDEVEQTPMSEKDIQSIKSFKEQLNKKYYELNGLNGFTRISDKNLNNFAQYSVQDLEQSAEYVTISVLTLVLIIIAAVLLL